MGVWLIRNDFTNQAETKISNMDGQDGQDKK
jgi:hypothetical protein